MEASVDTIRSHRDIQSALRIWPIIKEAIRIPWIRRLQFRALPRPARGNDDITLPGQLLVFVKDGARTIGILLQIPNFLIFSFFAVAVNRFILIGEHSVSRLGIPGWPRREFRFFCWLIFIYVIGGMFWLVTSEVVIRFPGFIETFLGGDLNELSVRLPGTKISVRFPWTFVGLIPCWSSHRSTKFIASSNRRQRAGKSALCLVAIEGKWLANGSSGWMDADLVPSPNANSRRLFRLARRQQVHDLQLGSLPWDLCCFRGTLPLYVLHNRSNNFVSLVLEALWMAHSASPSEHND